MSLSKARAALEELAKIVNINPAPSKKTRSGVIFSLRSKAGLVYIGFEYEGRIEYELKDLLVRYLAYVDMGYLFESSASVFADGPVEFRVLEKIEVSSKYELAARAEGYMLELGASVCVNVYKPEELLRGFAVVLYDGDKRIDEIEKYKSEKEKELEGITDDVREYKRQRMVELREMKEELYEKLIEF